MSTDRVPPWAITVAAMFSVQLSSSLAVSLIDRVGSGGTAWLRLCMGALLLLVLARPPLRLVRRQDVPVLLGLGLATGLMTVGLLAAIDRIPLGTAVAIEFLGPLTVAAVRSHSRQALAWPALALVGVVLLTEPWHGHVDLVGVALAIGAGVAWATYIVLTQHVGDRFHGLGTLSITVPIAAVLATVVGLPQVGGRLTPGVLAAALGLAVLMPVLPLTLELLALRRMSPAAFGTLMALEPAFGVLLGAIVLGQLPTAIQVVGIVLVVVAGAAAQRTGPRQPAKDAPLDPLGA